MGSVNGVNEVALAFRLRQVGDRTQVEAVQDDLVGGEVRVDDDALPGLAQLAQGAKLGPVAVDLQIEQDDVHLVAAVGASGEELARAAACALCISL